MLVTALAELKAQIVAKDDKFKACFSDRIDYIHEKAQIVPADLDDLKALRDKFRKNRLCKA